jgi:peptidyl-prolyl cis-trans isomerase A (cyclophilin A)
MSRTSQAIALALTLVAGGCRDAPTVSEALTKTTSPAPTTSASDAVSAPVNTAPALGDPAAPPVLLNPSPAMANEPHLYAPLAVLLEARAAITRRDRAALAPYFLRTAAGDGEDPLQVLPFEHLTRLLAGTTDGPPTIEGRRAVIKMKTRRNAASRALVMFNRNGYRIDLAASNGWKEVDPGPEDPLNTPVQLKKATVDIAGAGVLVAVFATSRGEIRCVLHETKAPRTVANFVALARGLRGFKDPQTGAWAKRPFFDRLPFHRTVAGQLIQSGDPYGDGRGGPGYTIADELHADLRHDAVGTLSMANRGANTGGSQFFITLRPMPSLDDRHAVFGHCEPADVIGRIAAGEAIDGKAVDPTRITGLRFERREAL